ncbi:MAG: hypothetical protein KDD41_04855 [Flavobacteriales bacterium]|nr:hypothetical protein [Flavobacteriales bacterium]
MRKIFFITGLLLVSFFGHTQILEINQPLFTDEPFFNPAFIKANKVKSITGSISSKKINDIIRTKGLDYFYEFNDDGTLLMQLASNYSKGIKDSSIVTYCYNENGSISLKRKSDSYGYYSHHYKYDADGNIMLQTYCRDENRYECKNKFELKNQFVIVADSFSYQKTDPSQTKKFYYNAYKKVYKEQINYYDEYGYLVEEYTRFIIGNNKKKITYEYDEMGRLSKKHTFTDIAQGKKETEVYTYDEVGNVLDIKFYQNEQHKTTKEFLYDKNMLLYAQLIKDIESDFLRIIQYRYTFWGENKYVDYLPSDSVSTQ